ncbi:MAG: GntR family transcriptional regulator [Corynebacteriales bacterium]|nr:GntR family transcriptional regulator [Mycobacteriales bacterium]
MNSDQLGYTDARPLQVRVSDEIRASIENGELEPGQQLPTLEELARDYLCSLAVVRKALDLLRQQGLVITRQGKGSYVRKRPSLARHSMERYAKSRWQGKEASTILDAEAKSQGKKATRIIRELGKVAAPTKVAEGLNLEKGATVWTRKRTTFLDGRPNQLADSYYPLEIAEGTALTAEETGPGGDFARLDDAGHTPTRIREEWHVRMPTGPEAGALRLPPGTPVIDFARTILDQDDRPVEVMLSVIAGDTASFVYEFRVPD